MEIKTIEKAELPVFLDIIHRSFATAAEEFGLTRENCPKHTAFLPIEYLETQFGWGWLMFGLYDCGTPVGYVSLSAEDGGTYELHHLAVLPEFRHRGGGKRLLDHAKAVVNENRGTKITIEIIEESTVLREWYAANGFLHTGTEKFPHLPFTTGFMEWRNE
ncbi:MAG: GNAT family N-acetyltransferase [Clostridia bacterium]|nr:GNAT family N-acetyltransferase [Clostridia bacterium]